MKAKPKVKTAEDYYAHFVTWRKRAWPKADLPDDLPWIVSNFASHFPGRLAPLALQLIKERDYGTERPCDELPEGEGGIRPSPQEKPGEA